MRAFLFSIFLLTGCLGPTHAEGYAQRAFPDCTEQETLNHIWNSQSQTEIAMTCEDQRRSITIKCIWAMVGSTTCHENN